MNPFDHHSNTHSAPTDLIRRAHAFKRLNALRSAPRGNAAEARDRALREANALYLRAGLTLAELSVALRCSASYLWGHFRRLGLHTHDSTHRRAGHVPARTIALGQPGAFAVIDTPQKAHLLGLLIADAKPRIRMRRVHNRKTKVYEGLEYIVQRRDRWALKRLKDLLESAATIKPTTTVLTHRGTTKHHDDLSLIVYSSRLARDLAALGVVPGRATRNLPLPQLRSDLVRHLIRGLFDGDGWITRDARVKDPLKGWSCGVCGCRAVLSDVRRFAKQLGIAAPPICPNGPNNLKLQWSGIEAVRLLERLYGETDLALPRKKVVARALVAAYQAAYPDGTDGSTRYQHREGKRWCYLTDDGRVGTRQAQNLASRALTLWTRNIHPTRGRRKGR
jgi:hypothetical protein